LLKVSTSSAKMPYIYLNPTDAFDRACDFKSMSKYNLLTSLNVG